MTFDRDHPHFNKVTAEHDIPAKSRIYPMTLTFEFSSLKLIGLILLSLVLSMHNLIQMLSIFCLYRLHIIISMLAQSDLDLLCLE